MGENTLTMVDLFAGCGGVTLGFKEAGFRVVSAVEIDPVTAHTYRLNHPEVFLYNRDIREVNAEEMLKKCNLEEEELTVLSVCAPCQPFSRQNRSQKADPRVQLVLESLRFVATLRPKFLFFENVPGLHTGKYRDVLTQLVLGLRERGYSVSEPQVVNAVDYGVPQFRKRLILLASRGNSAVPFPEPTHAPPEVAQKVGKKPWRTVKDALAGLPPLKSGEQDPNDPLHKARKHRPLSLERLKHIPHNGGSRDSLPPHLQLNCHKNGRNVGYHDVYGRMDYRKPANTLTTGCTNFTKGRFAHPEQDRAITPREAARLQTFPDSYRFYGTYEQISAQIGNAVPVQLAKAFANMFRNITGDDQGEIPLERPQSQLPQKRVFEGAGGGSG